MKEIKFRHRGNNQTVKTFNSNMIMLEQLKHLTLGKEWLVYIVKKN